MTSSLQALADCFHGAPPPHANWPKILNLANRGLVTASLALALEPAPDVPLPVRAFLHDVLRRNSDRNTLLKAQLDEAVRLLNSTGIEPVLLKGAAGLAVGGRGRRTGRMLCDLDILVKPSEVDRALSALQSSGYWLLSTQRGADLHAVAELLRDGSPATLDLHQRPPGPPGMAESDALCLRARKVDCNGATAWVPEPATELFLLMLHDQFHDGDYWSGHLNLRHLLDVRELVRDAGTLNWQALDDLVASPLVADALDTLLVDAAWLTDCPLPAPRLRRLMPQLQHARRMIQVSAPFTMWPFAAATVILSATKFPAHRRLDTAGRKRLFGQPTPSIPLRLDSPHE